MQRSPLHKLKTKAKPICFDMFVDGHSKPKVESDGEVHTIAFCRQDRKGELLLVGGGRRGGVAIFASQV